MGRLKQQFSDIVKTILILVLSFILCLFMQKIFAIEHLIPAVFTVAVFLITLITHGYICGVGASLISVLAVNFAFTFPYLKFNFTIPENFLSALIMITAKSLSRKKS